MEETLMIPPRVIRHLDLTGDLERGRGNFLLRPRAVMYPMNQDYTGRPQRHKEYIIINVGKAEIKAELEYGTKQEKHGVLDSCVLKPGDEIALQPGDGFHEVSTVRITNATHLRAAFQMEGGVSSLPPSAGEHYHELLDKETKNVLPGTTDLSESTKRLAITDTDMDTRTEIIEDNKTEEIMDMDNHNRVKIPYNDESHKFFKTYTDNKR